MRQPVNAFKAALARDEVQIGLWLSLADAYVTELVASTGFDWLLIDGEHAPNDLRSVLAQLQAIAAYPVSAVVRPVRFEPALIKQYLDLGVQTLLVPMVHGAEQARAVVAATRYPPRGIRGVGGDMSRVTRWSGVDDYVARADAEVCVVVQAESRQAMADLAAIAAVDGVDGVFFGPSDLSASMGLLGQPGHPDVRAAIDTGIATVRAAGKAAGIIATDRAVARHYLDAGARFVAVGVEAGLLVGAARDLARAFDRGS
jgi:4-hydroxy-2-oxoheptanedioate aldolase